MIFCAALMWETGRKFTLLLIFLSLVAQHAFICLAREGAFHGELVIGGICCQKQNGREVWESVLGVQR